MGEQEAKRIGAVGLAGGGGAHGGVPGGGSLSKGRRERCQGSGSGTLNRPAEKKTTDDKQRKGWAVIAMLTISAYRT
jgi:hypothetical protein